MSTRLEQFIKDNREDFDSDEPSPKVWDNIQEKIMPDRNGTAPVVKMNFMRWSAAAAAVILVVLGTWFMMRAKPKNDVTASGSNEMATVEPKASGKKQNDTIAGVPKNQDNTAQQTAKADNTKKNEVNKEDAYDPQADAKEEMVHFAKLVEIKHRQLKNMAKDEPLLYKQFSGDVNKLDSVYHSLQNQLSTKQNSEELLEAMIQNLQLQMQLLNRQLGIIKQLNHSKKSAYDKAYQSI